jgi:hypothetical protein
MAVIGGMSVVSQNNEQYRVVEKVLSRMLEVVGWGIIFFTAYKLVTEFGDFAKKQTFFDFVVPVLLSLLLLPYVYVVYIFISYENIFTRLQFSIEDNDLRAYAKKKACVKFHLKVSELKRWSDWFHHANIGSMTDIDNSIAEIKRRIDEEKNPPDVPWDKGWSPYLAASFLADEGLKTGDYKKGWDQEWFACSPYLEIGSGLLPNNIAFYLEGDSDVVKCLKLKMNINEKAGANIAHQTLLRIASLLCKVALVNNINDQMSNAILNGSNGGIKFKSKIIRVKTEYWANNKGYEVGFIIENA